MNRFDSRPNANAEPTDDHADNSDQSRETRRGFLARAGAIGVLPAFVGGDGSIDPADATSTPIPERPATSDASAAGAQADAACASVGFERRYDPLFGGPSVGAELAELDGDGYAILGRTGAGELRLLRTGDQREPRFTRTYDIGLEVSHVSGVVDTDDGFVALGDTADRCWLASVDTACDARWVREYDSAGGCRSLVRTAEGGYAWVTETGDGAPVAHVVDEQGETVWRQSYSFDFGEYPDLPAGNAGLSAIVQLEDGGFVLAGAASGGDLIQAPVWMVRTDAEGNRLDGRLYGKAPPASTQEWDFHRVFDAVRTAEGGVALTGYVGDNPSTTNSPETRFLFMTVGSDLELDTYGVAETSESLPACGASRGTEIVRTDGGFVLAGWTGACLPDPEDHVVAQFISLALDGAVQWTYRYPEDYEERSSSYAGVHDVVRTASDEIAAFGWSGRSGDEDRYDWLLNLTVQEQC